MKIRLLSQPYQLQFSSLLAELSERAAAAEFHSVHIAVAFAKMSAISRLAKAIETLQGKTRISLYGYVGIDHDGTSREAVEYLNRVCTRLVINHSTRRDVTFHPKVYFFEGEKSSCAIVGSPNFTSGGLYTNVESGIFIEEIPSSAPLNQEFKDFLSAIGDTNQPNIVLVSPSNLTSILADLPTELMLWKTSKASDGSTKSEKTADSIFGAGSFPTAPKLSTPRFPTAPKDRPEPRRKSSETESFSLESINGFWKQLSKWDVAERSSPGQIQIPKEFAPLFPPLGGATETPSGATQSDVTFKVRFFGFGSVQEIADARFIKYEPAAHHPRPNIEHRFTFHRRSINPEGLDAADILVFELLTDDPGDCWFNVFHVPKSSPDYEKVQAISSGRFGAIYPSI